MLGFEKKRWIITQLNKGKSVTYLARVLGVSRQAIYDIGHTFEERGLDALRDKPVGRPEEQLPLAVRQSIISLRKEGHGIRRIEGLLKIDRMTVSHNKIHKLLTLLEMMPPEPKKGRRRHYIRWERKHSNSLWQTDFCWVGKLDCWLCGWLDDHSRFVPVAEYVTEATTDSVLSLFEKTARKYGYPAQTLSDRGDQFHTNPEERPVGSWSM